MIKIFESAGDIKLSKFIFISTPKIDLASCQEYNKYYDNNLKGYYIQWDYHYNKNTKETDDRLFSHSDMIDSLPKELANIFRHSNGCGYGRTDYNVVKDNVSVFISDGINKNHVPYIMKMIGVR